LELGIGQGEVDVGKDQIQQFSPSLYHYIELAMVGGKLMDLGEWIEGPDHTQPRFASVDEWFPQLQVSARSSSGRSRRVVWKCARLQLSK
jgi:hypothetical protein